MDEALAGPSQRHPHVLECVPHKFTDHEMHRSHQDSCIFSVPELTLRTCVYATDRHANACTVCRDWSTDRRRKYRRRLISYVRGVDKHTRPPCYSRSVSRVLFSSARRSPSPAYVPSHDEDDEPAPSHGPMLIQWAASFNPNVLATTTSSTYAPGGIGFEGLQSSQQLIIGDPGVSGAFLRGMNAHLQVPPGDFPQTLSYLSSNLHASSGAGSDPHKALPHRFWSLQPEVSSLFQADTLSPEGLGHGSWAVTPVDGQVRRAHKHATHGLKYLMEAAAICSIVIPRDDTHHVPPEELRPMLGNLREALCASAAAMGELLHPALVHQRTATLRSSNLPDMDRFLQEPYVPGSILGPRAQDLWSGGPDMYYENSRMLRQLAMSRQRPQQSRGRSQKRKGPSSRSGRQGPYQTSRPQQQAIPRSPQRGGRQQRGGPPKRGGGPAPKKRF